MLYQSINDFLESEYKQKNYFENVYQQALTYARSNLQLHGYSEAVLMQDQKMPQTKQEIENFADDMSWHDWLQLQANSKYKLWQLFLGLVIGLSLFIVIGGSIVFVCWRYHTIYNVAGARKKTRPPYEKYNKKLEKIRKKTNTKNLSSLV